MSHDIADQKAQEAFASMTAREHRHAAVHDAMCPNDGAVMFLVGRPMNMVSDKVEALQKARALLQSSVAHLDAAITAYEESVKQ
jgi:hypothetical protein